ncbi:MAG: hypothetical protein HYX32_08105 [Actinobacteria bacterium]|nr:hypothetical protein [Actinomycetota bacterium]
MSEQRRPVDPVLARRQLIDRYAKLAQRVGYALLGVAIVVFFIALATGFPSPLVVVITWTLVAGSVVLAPAMVIGYTVKAADRADREDDWR